ncbi:PIN domain-containing protein [Candidatus Woesearchaeota archaeon]|nr:PIN domain-containing protein [Candidatus Woesearchaeota archaeon]
MKLVPDTNILIAALVRSGVSREILLHPSIEFILPEYALEEVEKNWPEILKKSRLPEDELRIIFDDIKQKITIVPFEEITELKKAAEIMDSIHPNDSPFIALALSVRNDGIWSQDKHFEQKKVVKVWKTQDLIHYLEITHA